jgi:hypothetical protein
LLTKNLLRREIAAVGGVRLNCTTVAVLKKEVKKMAKTTKKPQTKGLTTKKTTTKAKTPAKKTTTAKKAAAKKPAAKKATAKAKAPAKKTTTAKSRTAGRSAKGKNVTAQFLTGKGKLLTRRPPNNPDIPLTVIRGLYEDLDNVKYNLELFSAHLRSLDRKRLNGIGMKKLGFIGRALELAAENPEFLPHWLDIEKFQDDNNNYLALRSLYDIVTSIKEILWNIVLQASDILYTDALEYYSQVGDAAKRRIDPAETLYNDLRTHFKGMGKKPETEPTEKKAKRDFNALLHGKKDGKIEVENISPKTTGGVHKIIDETWKDTAQFKKSEEGDIEE